MADLDAPGQSSFRQNGLLTRVSGVLAIVAAALTIYFLYRNGLRGLSELVFIATSLAVFIEGMLLLRQTRHRIIAIMIILEAVVLFIFFQYSPYRWFVVPLLLISGLLNLIYNPVPKPKSPHPISQKWPALVLLSSIFMLIVIIIMEILQYYLISSQNASFLYVLSLVGYSTYLLYASWIVGMMLPLTLLVSGLKMRSTEINKVRRWSLISLALSILVAIFAYTLLSAPYNFALLSSIASGATTASHNQINIVLLLGIIGGITLFGGIGTAASAFAVFRSKANESLPKFVTKRYKLVVLTAVAAVIIIAVYLNVSISLGNAYALKSLNDQIYEYGGNLRYLLANKTMFLSLISTNSGYYTQNYSQLYEALYNESHNQTTINEALGPNSTYSGAATAYDWGEYNPIIRGTVVYTLYYLGLPVLNSTKTPPTLNLPESATDLESLYQLRSTGTGILLIADALSVLYYSGVFGGTVNYTAYTKQRQLTYVDYTYGNYVGSESPYYSSKLSGGVTTTASTTSSGDQYDYSSASVVGWLVLASNIGGPLQLLSYRGLYNNTITDKQLFYLAALTQYDGYLSSQILYNKSMGAGIDGLVYNGNTLIIDLGNLNLTSNQSISLHVDGIASNYTRYYNFLVADGTIGVGLHNITVGIGSQSSSAPLYISPAVLEPESVTLSTNGNLSMTLSNQFSLYTPNYSNHTYRNSNYTFYPKPGFGNVILSDINLSNAPPSFDYINGTRVNSVKEFPGIMEYATQNSYGDITYSNAVAVTPNQNYTIPSNSEAQLTFYTGPPSSVGSQHIFFFSANSNYGKAYYIIYTKTT